MVALGPLDPPEKAVATLALFSFHVVFELPKSNKLLSQPLSLPSPFSLVETHSFFLYLLLQHFRRQSHFVAQRTTSSTLVSLFLGS